MSTINEYIAAILSDAAYTPAGRVATAGLGVNLTTLGWTDITEKLRPQAQQPYFNNDENSFTNEFRVFVNTDADHPQIVIAFKGSKQIENFVSDLNPNDLGYTQYASIATQAQAYYDFLRKPGGQAMQYSPMATAWAAAWLKASLFRTI
jgi:hypothetical protein